MKGELDLYAGPGIPWRKAVALASAFALVMGVAGYKWMTTSTPVSSDQAVDIFRAEKGHKAPSDTRTEPARRKKGSPVTRRQADSTRSAAKTASQPSAAAAATTQTRAGDGTSSSSQSDGTVRTLPEDGVYSWATDGYEQAAGARRSLPKEMQRIITLDGKHGWTQHDYFSEQREAWTEFRVLKAGVSIASQRNKVTFGPVTNDETITFAPPMLVGPTNLEVGQRWEGSWKGDTYGTYTGRTFEHRFLEIGQKRVEVWAVEVLMEMKGEVRGEVQARVWIAPEYGMTVKEHFVQDVEADVGTYHAEWTTKLKSVRPRR